MLQNQPLLGNAKGHNSNGSIAQKPYQSPIGLSGLNVPKKESNRLGSPIAVTEIATSQAPAPQKQSGNQLSVTNSQLSQPRSETSTAGQSSNADRTSLIRSHQTSEEPRVNIHPASKLQPEQSHQPDSRFADSSSELSRESQSLRAGPAESNGEKEQSKQANAVKSHHQPELAAERKLPQNAPEPKLQHGARKSESSSMKKAKQVSQQFLGPLKLQPSTAVQTKSAANSTGDKKSLQLCKHISSL